MADPTADALRPTFSPWPPPMPSGRARTALGVVRYTTNARAPALFHGVPVLSLPMVHTLASQFAEVWSTGRPKYSGIHQGIAFAHDGAHLMCGGYLRPAAVYRHAVCAAYSAVFELLELLHYPTMLRTWNFLGDINGMSSAGLGVYQDFCAGRDDAFERHPAMRGNVTAATGIGALGGGVSFYLLATRSGRRTNIENPRQTPSYQYPERYGRKPPRFARAAHLAASGGGRGQLFVSGTASIVGHETVHPGDVVGQ